MQNFLKWTDFTDISPQNESYCEDITTLTYPYIATDPDLEWVFEGIDQYIVEGDLELLQMVANLWFPYGKLKALFEAQMPLTYTMDGLHMQNSSTFQDEVADKDY